MEEEQERRRAQQPIVISYREEEAVPNKIHFLSEPTAQSLQERISVPPGL
jgi:hypothetical protein